MKVYKFGGASVKDPEGIRNLARIAGEEKGDLVIVVSAFGKTTNALESLLRSWLKGDEGYSDQLENLYQYHSAVTGELFADRDSTKDRLENSFATLREYLLKPVRSSYDFEYDQIVSFGELWSTMIVSGYLASEGHDNEWIDIRANLVTDDRYRDANILWNESSHRIKAVMDFTRCRVFVTQGFIGGTVSGQSTTLGREGSDFTAAILANILNADSVTVWKDVPGILNADPKWLDDATQIAEMSYREAVEMTFSGAKVIHPKTIKPLQNKNIPLYVRSFLEPANTGTVVVAEPELRRIIPVFIRKENQILLSLLPRDFSFVMGDNLSLVFQLFKNHGIKVNLVEASAVSINVCVDDERSRVEELLNDLRNDFSAVYNTGVELLSVRHYNDEALLRITSGREILLEQRTRSTARFVVRVA
ncbi:MAG: aspartate kinase [Bacteroidales bacterium]|jgi:aspartate kinase|nr:aspartate kinase [Bacteroidales bacterium]